MSYQGLSDNPDIDNHSESPEVPELLVSWEPVIDEVASNEVKEGTVATGIPSGPSTSFYRQLSFSIDAVSSVDVESPARGASPHPLPISPTGERRMTLQREPVRRYSEADLSTAEIVQTASDIFNVWDKDFKGFIHVDDIKLPNLDARFIRAIGRVLALNSEVIRIDHVIECISVLENGDLSSKVKLLMQFLDEDGNQSISFSEIQSYMKGFDAAILEKIGISSKTAHDITYDDLLLIFESSDRGCEAMGIFCHQILRLLLQATQQQQQTQQNTVRHLTRQFSRRASGGGSSTAFPEPSSLRSQSSPPFSTICQNFLAKQKEKIVKRVKQLSHVEFFKIVLILLQIAFWLINFFWYRSHGYPLAFCIAKGFGLNLRVLSIFIYGTMARTTMGQLYSIPLLRPLIPLGINIEVHSFIGYSIALHMFGHTFSHIAYQTIYTSGFQNAFTQNSLLRSGDWESKLKGDGKTGFLLLAFVLVMGITALFRSFSSQNYLIFNVVHYFYLLYLPMLFLHIPQLWPYFLAIGGLMILERGYDLYQKTYYTTLAHSRPCHNGVTFLSVPRSGKMSSPGSYYRIKIPALSYHEWHPFSLAGGTSSHNLTFFIASAGDWSRALHKLVSDPQLRQTTIVQVQGPFLAPASQALIRKPGGKILCVASGIGITPFFSVMATKVTTEVNYENDRVLYHALFEENGIKAKGGAKKRNEPVGLLQVLQTTRQRRKVHEAKETSDASNGDHSSGDVEQGRTEIPRRGTNSSIELSPNVSNSTLVPTPSAQPDDLDDEEEDSMVKVVWSIRDCKELSFYLDYVHHLVKSQEQLNQHFYQRNVPKRILLSEELLRSRRNLLAPEGGDSPRTPPPQKHRNAVEVEVYLTGLGNQSDPMYMLSQTLFLLSIANKSSSYMKINFGRPDLKKIVKTFHPDEAYYCGGNALKENLQVVCHEEHVPFHPEDFDAGGGDVVKAIQKILSKFLPSFLFPQPPQIGGGGDAKKGQAGGAAAGGKKGGHVASKQ